MSCRPYTPVTDDDTPGRVEFVIKVYPQGKLTQIMDKMKVGDTMQMKGPRGRFQYTRNMKRAIGKAAVCTQPLPSGGRDSWVQQLAVFNCSGSGSDIGWSTWSQVQPQGMAWGGCWPGPTRAHEKTGPAANSPQTLLPAAADSWPTP